MTWSTTTPIDDTTIGNVPTSIRNAKADVKTELDREHSAIGSDPTSGIHKAGSAVIYADAGAPGTIVRPDGSSALTAADEGRLYYDTTNKVLYFYTGSAWEQVTASGSGGGTITLDDLAKLGGRSGGQTLYGGTAASDDLTLGATSSDSTITGGIEISSSKTAYFDFNDVPLQGMTMKSGETISGLASPTATNEAVGLNQGVLTTADCSSTGGIPVMAHFSHTVGATFSTNTVLTITMPFSDPTCIIFNYKFSDDGEAVDKCGIWITGMGNTVWEDSTSTSDAISVSGTTLIFYGKKIKCKASTDLHVCIMKDNRNAISAENIVRTY